MMSAKDYALKLLALQDRTEHEIRDKMRQKGYGAADIESVVAFLHEYGYVNDMLYCRRYVADAKNLRHYGERRIRSELAKRGVAREITDEVLSEYESDGADDIAGQLETRFSDIDFSDMRQKQRVFNYFLRRGFDASAIKTAIERKSGEDTYLE